LKKGIPTVTVTKKNGKNEIIHVALPSPTFSVALRSIKRVMPPSVLLILLHVKNQTGNEKDARAFVTDHRRTTKKENSSQHVLLEEKWKLP